MKLLLLTGTLGLLIVSPRTATAQDLHPSPRLQSLDLDADGLGDLCAIDAEGGLSLLRGVPTGFELVPLAPELAALRGISQVVAFDPRGDGAVELLLVVPGGRSRVCRSTGGTFDLVEGGLPGVT